MQSAVQFGSYLAQFLQWEMFQTKVVEKIKTHTHTHTHTHFVMNNVFKNCVVYEIIWKNIVQPDRPQMTIWLMRIACWMPRATNAHSQYVMSVVLPLHRMVAQMRLSVTLYIACLVISVITIHKMMLLTYWFHETESSRIPAMSPPPFRIPLNFYGGPPPAPLVTSSTGSIRRSNSQLDEASPSFLLFVNVTLLYYPPSYATSQVLSSLILILRQKRYVHIAFMSRGNVCFGISDYFV